MNGSWKTVDIEINQNRLKVEILHEKLQIPGVNRTQKKHW